jgi:hypothetical protein
MYALTALRAHIRMADAVARVRALLREWGPYVAIELLLPGGSLIALLLWLRSRHRSGKPILPLTLRTRIVPTASVLQWARLPVLRAAQNR